QPSAPKLRELRLLVELTVVASGLVLGYAATTLSGSPQLRYGFVRDFLLPAALSSIVVVTLASIVLWTALSRVRPKLLTPESVFVVVAVIGSACLVAGVAYARLNGIPRIESRQLGAVTYVATCRADRCDVTVAARTTAGRSTSIPRSSTLTFECGGTQP